MITQLSIRGLAIIEELHIEFSPQLNVITGETGAGKSILIKALHFLLGAKADPDVIRQGFARAHVAGSFLLPRDHPSIDLLAEHGLIEEHDLVDVILRREISQKGRSQAWVNDQPITLAFLKEVGHALIDIYGQHENHRMLDPSTHLEYIDQFLKEPGLRQDMQGLMGQIHHHVGELRRRVEQFHVRRREQDYLQFRYNELSQFDPSPDDYARTMMVCQDAARAQAEQRILAQAQSVCDEAYQGRALTHALQELGRLVEQSRWLQEEADVHEELERLRDLTAVIDQLSYRLGRVASRKQWDEEEIEKSQARLAGYQGLFRKLGVRTIDEMYEEYQRLERELSLVTLAPEELSLSLRKLSELVEAADGLARRLSAARQKAAERAVKSVVKELHDLNMKGARISFDFQAIKNPLLDLGLDDLDTELATLWSRSAETLSELGRLGREKGQFLLAANPGEGFKPLAKVASGGEVSRIMLGFKRALAVGANTCVMVFDEIDTGISGHTAHIVGRKLKELSTSFQVICISHLPQVAAYGDAHFLVQKSQTGKSTESRIFRLTPPQSEEEIARLLSGDQVTSSSLAHAKQLIRDART